MLVIHHRLVMLVACKAGELRVRCGIGMTCETGGPLCLMRAAVDPEVVCVMIERRWRPGCRRMTRLALMAEIQRCVIHGCRLCEFGLMTLVAVGINELIVAVRMARL